jgi:hypothetical protein
VSGRNPPILPSLPKHQQLPGFTAGGFLWTTASAYLGFVADLYHSRTHIFSFNQVFSARRNCALLAWPQSPILPSLKPHKPSGLTAGGFLRTTASVYPGSPRTDILQKFVSSLLIKFSLRIAIPHDFQSDSPFDTLGHQFAYSAARLGKVKEA